MSEPHLWYPLARDLSPRKVICHVGPTNSGKTHSALESLAKAKTGVYCGPLRLLAWEVYEALREKSVKCDLITGQERDQIPDATHVSCTVEMTDLSTQYDCAVIDETQVIGDSSRGWAWTQALLGVQAKEIHLCGNASFLPLIRRICHSTGDTVEVREYTRLAPLVVTPNSHVQSLRAVRRGDCIVAFSRKKLYKIKASIEKLNPQLRCCIIYGALPPDARRQQALLFNGSHEATTFDRKGQKKSRSQFDVLVASDAVGMGLNLAIKRVVFSSLVKFDGTETRRLLTSEIKQIAGRAGRYGSEFEQGEVTAMSREDVCYLKERIEMPDDDIHRAGLFPTREQLELLGAFLDTGVSRKELKSFWADKLSGARTTEQRMNNRHVDADDFYRTSYVLQHFRSVGAFACALTDYVDYVRSRKKSKGRRKGRDIIYASDSDDSDMFDSDDSVDTLDDGPRTPLSVLFDVFKNCVELGTDGIYFINDLDEKREQAAAISEFRMRFRDRYMFCLAPVNIDSKDVMKAFRSMARQFSRGDEVILSKKHIPPLIPPKGPDELLILETAHQIMDLYMWLSFRFPEQFIQAKEISAMSAVCVSLIDSALKNLRMRSTITGRGHSENEKKKIMVSGKRT
eukprot:CAMPEP_0185033648 /NCGR_PEP_ID=MMETSP1103-20130426/22779_1 /TAXON_ID=36769 /ORGANISM="Paraphysomonas bandaiensis, Strain Caron Lab Isolate" /LENGTH=626 /DNA_ID=CAMNT_0027569993 /DNA_START=118 /DNA_END=1995 /DNA_ORIENTATION=-